jgi:hypothetical protein
LFVIFVSVLDGYLAIRFRHELHQTERNPLGRWLIHANDGQVWLLLAVKFAGTVTVAATVLVLYSRRPRVGFVIAALIAAFQLWLLWYLLVR